MFATWNSGKSLISFAGWKQHISLYPVPDGDEEFWQRIAEYRAGKGTLRFPLQQPIPLDLVCERRRTSHRGEVRIAHLNKVLRC